MTMPLWLAIMWMITFAMIGFALGKKAGLPPIFGTVDIVIHPNQDKDKISFNFDKELDDLINADMISLKVIKHTDNSSDSETD